MIDGFLGYLLPFLVVLTVLVFVHELGHYWVARRNGVRVEVFSVGFGPELFGFTDRAQTRWKFSAIPLGGYVKMYGDADAASSPDEAVPHMTLEQQAESFHHKRLGQRAAIVAAGPAANFLFAFVAFAALFLMGEHPFPAAKVGEVQAGSAAEAAGILPGDRIVEVDGVAINRFAELANLVRASDGESIGLTLRRDDESFAVQAMPEMATVTLTDGQEIQVPRLGLVAETGPYGPLEALGQAATETASITWLTLSGVGEIIAGDRSAEELGGPLRIAQMSGNVAQIGVVAVLWFMAILSINLGLINLFPVPMLDGGHLMFYAFEAVRGRPLGQRAQEYGFRIGLALVLTLMIFATWNDLVQLQVVAFFRNLIS